ncbi:5' nucleotidase, NT5C type [Ilumatobacter sp.]|uniref:5' nucleotidase, NT5C type n=1 Tax=Ilumatobacter sp. TaxID=1967498 RepID=UPI003C48BC51
MAARSPDQFILGVDLDGVVADHTRRFRDILADIRGVDPETYPLERSWDFGEWDLGPDEYADYHRVAVMEHDMFRTMEMIDGAADALWRLSDAGVWIRIITHRLYVHWGHEKAVADTAGWLDAKRIPYRDLCFLGAKPQAEAHAYIDDAPHNVEELRSYGNTVIVFDQPYNQGIEGPRAHDWTEVEAIVSDLATARVGRFESQLPGIDAGSDRIERHR